MQKLFDPSRGTFAGFPLGYVAVLAAVLLYFLYRKFARPLDSAGGLVKSVSDAVSGILD